MIIFILSINIFILTQNKIYDSEYYSVYTK